MKSVKWALLPALIGIISFSSCIIIDDNSGFGNCVRGSGDLVTETLDLEAFSRVKVDIDADVYITQGDVQEVIVEGKQNIIDELDLSISGVTWEITSDRCLRNTGKMKIFITIPAVDLLSITGSGNIQSENELVTDRLDLNISGSGDFDLAVNAEVIDCNVSGSGGIYLEGQTIDLDYSVSGSGDFNAFNMRAQNVDIKISGSGDVDVWAVDYLKVKISGSGDVRYKGHPDLDISITGSGDVRDAN